MKKVFDLYFKEKLIRGTILLANEGINGSIASDTESLEGIIKFIKRQLKIRKINLKKNHVDFLPFNKLKVRLKKEIVSLGISGLAEGISGLADSEGNYLHPSEWNNLMLNKETKIIDVRNNYEIEICAFKNAINPKTKNFREFPKKFENIGINKEDKIAMYCTGGIRCEKASAFLKKKGFKNVMQLKGGILNYFDYTKKNKKKNIWKGECFVFDKRVAVDKNLNYGNYIQCYGCRMPLLKSEMKSPLYLKGVHCKYCVNIRTKEQKNRSKIRQDQIEKKNRNKITSI